MPSGIGEGFKRLPTIAKLGIPVAGAAGYWVYRKRKANAATATAASTTAASSASDIDPQTGVAYSAEEAAYVDQNNGSNYGVSPGGSSFDPYQFYGPAGASTTSASTTATPTTTSGSSSSTGKSPVVTPSATPNTTSSVGFGQEKVGNTLYDILGTVGGKQGTYQVGQGAPVYFAGAGGTPQQGGANEKTGDLILTPASYSPFVSTKAYK